MCSALRWISSFPAEARVVLLTLVKGAESKSASHGPSGTQAGFAVTDDPGGYHLSLSDATQTKVDGCCRSSP